MLNQPSKITADLKYRQIRSHCKAIKWSSCLQKHMAISQGSGLQKLRSLVDKSAPTTLQPRVRIWSIVALWYEKNYTMGGRHSTMDPSVHVILRPRVQIPSTRSLLFRFIQMKIILHLLKDLKGTKIYKRDRDRTNKNCTYTE